MFRRMKGTWLFLTTYLIAAAAMGVEEAKYQVIHQEGDLELRKYQAHILAETTVNADFEEAGSEAFKRLFDYISGDNKAQQDIAMTSPVGQSNSSTKIAMTSPVGQRKQDEHWLVSFMMPASFTLATTPEPLDPSIRIRQVPARHIAAIRYSGFWSLENYQDNLETLQAWIETSGYQPTGGAIWARYNPPLMPWFLRRNEVLIPVALAQAK